MATAIERLKAFARAAAAPLSSLERRILAETGLPAVWEAQPDPIRATQTARLMPHAAADDFAIHFCDDLINHIDIGSEKSTGTRDS